MSSRHAGAGVLAALLATAGTLHLAVPTPFDAIVPRRLPGTPRFWTLASGIAELGVAGAVAVPRTRRFGATAAAALFIAVFPANVKMARDQSLSCRSAPQRSEAVVCRWRNCSDRRVVARTLAWGRLPLQVPLVAWALAVRRCS